MDAKKKNVYYMMYMQRLRQVRQCECGRGRVSEPYYY